MIFVPSQNEKRAAVLWELNTLLSVAMHRKSAISHEVVTRRSLHAGGGRHDGSLGANYRRGSILPRGVVRHSFFVFEERRLYLFFNNFICDTILSLYPSILGFCN